MTLFEIITALQNAQGGNAKKVIIEANKENDLLKEYLRVTYDPRINFYITEKTFPYVPQKELNYYSALDLEDIPYFVKALSEREVTGVNAKNWLSNTLRGFSKEDQQLIKWLLLKDIRAGVSVSTINKVWPNLIAEQPYMRCSLQKGVDLSKWEWESGVYSQVKMDGMYAAVSNKQVITRNGSVFPYDLLPLAFKLDMKHIPEGYELNGELIIQIHNKTLSRKEGNGLLNSLLQGTPLPKDMELHYTVWDVMVNTPKGYSDDYSTRFRRLSTTCFGKQYIQLIRHKIVYSLQEAHQHFTEVVSQGGEGTILKNPKGKWKNGTSKDQVKYKLECDVDLLCTGWIEGEGKHKGKIGALQCQSSDGKLKVNVGSGFTDKEREQEPPIGKIIIVKANDLIDKQNSDVYSLFLPIYVETRLDKSEADSFERIKSIFDSKKGLL